MITKKTNQSAIQEEAQSSKSQKQQENQSPGVKNKKFARGIVTGTFGVVDILWI